MFNVESEANQLSFALRDQVHIVQIRRCVGDELVMHVDIFGVCLCVLHEGFKEGAGEVD